MQRRSEIARRWIPLVAAFESSNQTYRDFAAAHGVKPGTLKWWRLELRRRGVSPAQPAPAFVEAVVEPVRVPLDTPPPIRLHFQGRPWSLEIRPETMEALVRVVEALA